MFAFNENVKRALGHRETRLTVSSDSPSESAHGAADAFSPPSRGSSSTPPLASAATTAQGHPHPAPTHSLFWSSLLHLVLAGIVHGLSTRRRSSGAFRTLQCHHGWQLLSHGPTSWALPSFSEETGLHAQTLSPASKCLLSLYPGVLVRFPPTPSQRISGVPPLASFP